MRRTRVSERGMLVGACVAALVCACHGDDGDSTQPGSSTPANVVVTSGNDQETIAGQPLADSISVLVLDRSGQPMSGIDVDWLAQQDSDRVEPAHSLTDSSGVAKTTWTLGPVPGGHTIIANVRGFGSVTVQAHAAPAPLVINEVHVLHLDTPDGSGQTAHPDFVNVAEAGTLQSQYLAITPYPFGNAEWENPNLHTSVDRVHWRMPDGGKNPVVLPARGFLSDPDLVFNPATQELWMYYRQVDVLNDILLIKSADGVTWSEPTLTTNGLNHTVVSPSVVRRSETDWLMWAVNGQAGCTAAETWIELRRSSNGETWSAPTRVSLTQPGFTPWHVDVQWIPTRQEYWAVYNVKTPESCSTPALYLATSPDGITWKTFPSPVLARGAIPAFSDIVYRSTFWYRPETDAITFWYSGAAYNGTRFAWSSAAQRRQRVDVFADIARVPTAALSARLTSASPALLTPP